MTEVGVNFFLSHASILSRKNQIAERPPRVVKIAIATCTHPFPRNSKALASGG